jgi:pimeloyl-ACP methyl ester carboxylesterase
LKEDERNWVTETSKRVIDQLAIEQTETKEGKLLSHTLDPVIARHRPLMLYMLVWSVQLCAATVLKFLGFTRGERNGVHYWHRACKSCEKKETEPVVFFHGIGPGPVFYLPLLTRLKDKEMLIVELPWISMKPWISVPRDPRKFAEDVLAIIDGFRMRRDERRIVLVGHSYGSVPIAWLMRTDPQLKCRLILIDPVTLYIIVPKVCYSFLYEEPRGIFSRIIRHWASEEIGVACTLRRGFYWTDCVQFAEDLPADSRVFLSAQDHIVPVDIVHEECKRHKHISVTTFPDIGHGGPCTVPAYAKLITQAIKN